MNGDPEVNTGTDDPRELGHLKSLRLLLAHDRPVTGFGAAESPGVKTFLADLTERFGLRAALSARLNRETNCYEVNAGVGFPPAFKPGRRLRLEQGWASKAIERGTPLTANAKQSDQTNLITFNPYERFGFDVIRLHVIPWSGLEGDVDGFLALVAASDDIPPPDPLFLDLLSGTLSLIRSNEQREGLLSKIRKYDPESGLLAESGFNSMSRTVFSSAKTKGVSLTLLLIFIADMDDMYLSHEPDQIYRFLESIGDRLMGLTQRPYVAGKFRTGLFGLLIDGITKSEMLETVDRAREAFGHGALTVGSERFLFRLKLSASHFPEDAQDLVGLWKKALAGVGLKWA
jgi:hypothetical protein